MCFYAFLCIRSFLPSLLQEVQTIMTCTSPNNMTDYATEWKSFKLIFGAIFNFPYMHYTLASDVSLPIYHYGDALFGANGNSVVFAPLNSVVTKYLVCKLGICSPFFLASYHLAWGLRCAVKVWNEILLANNLDVNQSTTILHIQTEIKHPRGFVYIFTSTHGAEEKWSLNSIFLVQIRQNKIH